MRSVVDGSEGDPAALSRTSRVSSSGTRARFALLDLLRICAALAVVAYHYSGRQSKAWDGENVHHLFPTLSEVTQYGFLGVELFFLISGFVIFMSSDGRALGQFAASRVARLYPAYWIAVLLTASLQAWLAPQLKKDVSLPQALVNLTMLQSPLRVKHVDGVYWTLWIEMTFYLLIAALIMLKSSDRGMTIFVFVWPVLSLVLTLTGSEILVKGLGVKYASYFAFGMLLYMIHKNGNRLIYWSGLVLNALIGIRQTVTFDVADQERVVGRGLSATVVAIILLAIFMLMVLAVLSPAKHVGGSWMIWAGGLTYPLYLIHEYWGWWAISIVNPLAGKWLAVVCALLLSLVLAYLIQRFVEKPLRPIVKKTVLRLSRGHLAASRR